MTRLRIAGRLAAILLLLAAALLIHGAWRLVRAPSPWPRLFLGGVARIVGARARVSGVALRRDVVFVSNHLSWLDILLLAGTTGSVFVAAAELRAAPLVGWLCTLNHTIFVDRDDRLNVRQQIGLVRDAIAAGWAVTIFPEGTTGDGTTLLPFKPTLLACLDPPPAGVRVQPVRIDYGEATGELAWVGEEDGRTHGLRVLGRRGVFTANLRFAEPFDPADHAGRKGIALEARGLMA